MIAGATTVVELWRDTDPNDSDGYGDPVETGDLPLYTGIPASIIEKSQTVPDPANGALVNVSAYVGRVGSLVDVVEGDRLKDRDGSWYAVLRVHQPSSPVTVLDKRLELSRS